MGVYKRLDVLLLGCLVPLLVSLFFLLLTGFFCLLSSGLLSSGLLGGVCRCFFGVIVKPFLNIFGQLGKIELGNTFLRDHNDSVRLYPPNRGVLVLFPVVSFEVVSYCD